MALKSTIYKAHINVVDLDKHVYLDIPHTIACHPSETLQRLMLRVVAWGLNADEALQFTKGVSSTEEPDLWQKSLSDEIELWIDLGLPDEKRIKKAASRAKKVIIYAYNDNAAKVWWKQNKAKIEMIKNVSIVFIDNQTLSQLEKIVDRSMQLQFTIESEQVWLSSGDDSLTINPEWWLKRD
ncbi:YaeQ family protein [Vibrio sp. SS-MA-C1-2]|uniref:YaeQ family protein n=1 Tax=Vibrio sp. SS-MA-C1-2 TaxID=2908646 RepID=UPI001F3276A1|nr:YaeQ family protein [Vibrio sp. SS-MA-C1-2]UJF16835.1 YaeQ family protein [Vibrio sp. SS-MA-C1-2]